MGLESQSIVSLVGSSHGSVQGLLSGYYHHPLLVDTIYTLHTKHDTSRTCTFSWDKSLSLFVYPHTVSTTTFTQAFQPLSFATGRMVVRLRLSRQGTRNNPFYHVVAINDSKPRDARPIEKLGEYDPIPRPLTTAKLPSPSLAAQGHGEIMTSRLAHPNHTQHSLHKRLEWNADRIKHWLQLGAQPSKPVARLLDRVRHTPLSFLCMTCVHAPLTSLSLFLFCSV